MKEPLKNLKVAVLLCDGFEESEMKNHLLFFRNH